MIQLIVKAKKLNKRKAVPVFLPDDGSIIGVVNGNFIFEGEEVEKGITGWRIIVISYCKRRYTGQRVLRSN